MISFVDFIEAKELALTLNLVERLTNILMKTSADVKKCIRRRIFEMCVSKLIRKNAIIFYLKTSQHETRIRDYTKLVGIACYFSLIVNISEYIQHADNIST